MSHLGIGFANTYYTLWSISEPYREYINEHQYYMKTDYTYIQNLSIDEPAAIKKAIEHGSRRNYWVQKEINPSLRGTSTSWTSTSDRVYETYEEYQFPYDFWKVRGEDIRTCDDIKALWSLYLKKDIWDNRTMWSAGLSDLVHGASVCYQVFETEKEALDYAKSHVAPAHTICQCPKNRTETVHAIPPAHSFKGTNPHWVRPVVYARRRLVELGIIVRHDGQYMTPAYIEKYEARKSIKTLLSNAKSGHHEDNGVRIDLQIKEVKRFGFEGSFGWTDIVTYIDASGRLFKYMGGSAPELQDKDTYTQIKATLKHNCYKEQDETRLQRIKILN